MCQMQICAHLTFPELKELLVTSLPSFGPCRVKSPAPALQRQVGLSNLPGAMLRPYFHSHQIIQSEVRFRLQTYGAVGRSRLHLSANLSVLACCSNELRCRDWSDDRRRKQPKLDQIADVPDLAIQKTSR